MHFGISEGKGGVKTWKPSMVGYEYFLELPITVLVNIFSVSDVTFSIKIAGAQTD